jgi:WD40 repeat protein
VTKQIQLGASPSGVLTGIAGGHSLVLTPTAGAIHQLDARLKLMGSRKFADYVSDFRLGASGTSVYAVCPRERELIELDGQTLKQIKRHGLTVSPDSLEVSSEGHVAVWAQSSGQLELIRHDSGKHIFRQLPGAISQAKFRADGKLLLVASRHDQCLSVFSVPGLEPMADLPLPMEPKNLCFNADGGQLLVTGPGMDAVAIVFPYRILEVEQTVLAGRDPGVMACSGDPTNYLFVASASGSDVCVMNLNTRTVVGIVGVGQKPRYIAITPDNQYALVLNESSGDVAVIHIAAVEAKISNADHFRTKSTVSLFTSFPVGSRPVQAAIVPRAI